MSADFLSWRTKQRCCRKKLPTKRKTPLSSRKIAKLIAYFASDKKAGNVIILDMQGIVNFCDYFVICSGNTDRHVRAIADGIDEGLKNENINIKYKEGVKKSDWIVFDAGDIVVHVFQKALRGFYNLEYLWQEAKEVKWGQCSS